MKTGEVAKMLGVSPKTITNWTDEEAFAQFFSDEAKGNVDSGTQRDFSTDDILVLNTIRVHKSRRNTWSDVAELMQTGHRETELPASAALTQTVSAVDQLSQLMSIKSERDTALAQLEDAMFEIERLRDQDKDRQSQIIDLNKQIARLELKLEMLQEQIKDEKEED